MTTTTRWLRSGDQTVTCSVSTSPTELPGWSWPPNSGVTVWLHHNPPRVDLTLDAGGYPLTDEEIIVALTAIRDALPDLFSSLFDETHPVPSEMTLVDLTAGYFVEEGNTEPVWGPSLRFSEEDVYVLALGLTPDEAVTLVVDCLDQMLDQLVATDG